MRRVFAPGDAIQGEGLRLTGEAAHYLARVLRLRPGGRFRAVLPDGGERLATVTVVDGLGVEARLGPLLGGSADPHVDLRLLPALPKAGKLELIIQKATELGVSLVQPVVCRRCVPRPQNADAKLARWERIAEEAARQCGRTVPPRIGAPLPLSEALAEYADMGGTGLLFSPEAEGEPGPLAPDGSPEPIWVLLGPEGGLTPEEREEAVRAGFRPVRFGRRVLRAETAAIAVTAALMYELGELR